MAVDFTSEQSIGRTEKARSMTALAGFVLDVFAENVRFRQSCGMDDELLKCKYAAKGEYTPEDLAKRGAAGLPVVYAPISDTKRRAANAWAGEIFLNTAEKTYEIHSTPIPEMPEPLVAQIAASTVAEWASIVSPEPPKTQEALAAVEQIAMRRRDELENLVKEEAERRAVRLDRVIHDRLVEGRWREEMTVAIDHASTYGTAVVKLVRRTRKRLRRKVNKYGVSTFSMAFEPRIELHAIDPMDCYPSKGSAGIGEGYFCQRIRYQPIDLEAMRGTSEKRGIFEDAIGEVLHDYASTGYRTYQTTDVEREQLNNDGATAEHSTVIEGVEFWGTVLGSVLLCENIQQDVSGKKILADAFYDIDCIVVNGRVIFCEMTDPRLGCPLFKGTFYSISGSWWGESPVKKMRHVQSIANGSITSLVWNMGMASGPQVVITDIERMRDQDLSQRPWKVWVFNQARAGSSDVPIKFFQPNTNSHELMTIYDRMSREADTLTGIPAYSHGSDIAAGAGRTASGLSMLLDAAQRGMKHVIFSLDLDLMRPMLTYLVNLEMMTSEDEGIKGDVTIDAGGLLSILTSDKTLAQLKEVIALCQNPLVANVIGEEGLSELLRRMVSLIPHINPDRIVPTREELEFRHMKRQLEQLRMQQMQQQMQQQGQVQGSQAPTGMSDSNVAGPVQLVDGVAPEAAMGGNVPGSTFNQYQPNHAPTGDVELSGGM